MLSRSLFLVLISLSFLSLACNSSDKAASATPETKAVENQGPKAEEVLIKYLQAVDSEDIDLIMSLMITEPSVLISDMKFNTILGAENIKTHYNKWFDESDFTLDFKILEKKETDWLSTYTVDISCNQANLNGKKKFKRQDRSFVVEKTKNGWKMMNGFSFN